MRVRDIPDNAEQITDMAEIRHILRMIGYPGQVDDYGCLFVIASNGDYDAIWALESNVPYSHKLVDQLYPMEG